MFQMELLIKLTISLAIIFKIYSDCFVSLRYVIIHHLVLNEYKMTRQPQPNFSITLNLFLQQHINYY